MRLSDYIKQILKILYCVLKTKIFLLIFLFADRTTISVRKVLFFCDGWGRKVQGADVMQTAAVWNEREKNANLFLSPVSPVKIGRTGPVS